jgi:hypothetical protein
VKRKAGQPTKFRKQFSRQVEKLYTFGLTDPQVCQALGITDPTLQAWKRAHEEFLSAVKRGKAEADAKVEKSLFQRACGYSHPDVDIRVVANQIVETPLVKHYPPDTVACIFWLKNRRSGEWRDRTEHTVEGPNGAPLVSSGLLAAAAALAVKMSSK